jgi:hypothetical protein
MYEQALNVVGKSVNFIRGKLKENDVEKVPVVAVDWDKIIDSNFHRVELHSASPEDLYKNLQVLLDWDMPPMNHDIMRVHVHSESDCICYVAQPEISS